MYKVNNLPASCSEQKQSFAQRGRDCFARTEQCSILKKMLCKNGDCPFYKSKKQHSEDIKKYPPMDSKKPIGGGKRGRRKKNGG